jgi:hypothetical protein
MPMRQLLGSGLGHIVSTSNRGASVWPGAAVVEEDCIEQPASIDSTSIMEAKMPLALPLDRIVMVSSVRAGKARLDVGTPPVLRRRIAWGPMLRP